MDAVDVLQNAADHIGDRAASRDTASERSMARCVSSFNALMGTTLTVEQGWLFMVFLKLSRMQGGEFRLDDYEDAVAYMALATEEANPEDPSHLPTEEDLLALVIKEAYADRVRGAHPINRLTGEEQQDDDVGASLEAYPRTLPGNFTTPTDQQDNDQSWTFKDASPVPKGCGSSKAISQAISEDCGLANQTCEGCPGRNSCCGTDCY